MPPPVSHVPQERDIVNTAPSLHGSWNQSVSAPLGHSSRGTFLSANVPPLFPSVTAARFHSEFARPCGFGLSGVSSSGAGCDYNYSLVRELDKLSIDPFDGSPHYFWSWYKRMEQKLNSAPLNPLQVILLLQENTTGDPRIMIRNHIASRAEITHHDISNVCERLRQRFGSSAAISSDILRRLDQLPPIRGRDMGKQMLSLCDILRIIEFNMPYNVELQMFNCASGLNRVRCKLPFKVQEAWNECGQQYKLRNHGAFPPFGVFVEFLTSKSALYADEDFPMPQSSNDTASSVGRRVGRIMKTTGTYPDNEVSGESWCMHHERSGHSLDKCKAFEKLPYVEKKQKVFKWKICFKCLGDHFVSKCHKVVKCEICGGEHTSVKHGSGAVGNSSAAHVADRRLRSSNQGFPVRKNRLLCTQVCSDLRLGRNCSMVVLVDLSMMGVKSKNPESLCDN